MKKLVLAIFVLLLIVSPVFGIEQPWCGIQTSYFQHNASTSPAGYEELINIPSGNPQEDEFVTVSSSTGKVLIDSYITPNNQPGVSKILAGLRRYRTYHYVDTASGVTTINFTAFKRTLSGNEIYMYSFTTEEINALTPTEYLNGVAVPNDVILNTTDRIVVKIYGQTTHPSPVNVHFVYQGLTNTSHYDSGYYVCAENNAARGPRSLPVEIYLPVFALIVVGFFIYSHKE